LIKNITLNSKKFSTMSGEKTNSNFNFQVNKKGNVNILGKIGINPLSADVAVSVDQIHLARFQPFVSKYLNLIISDGKFSTSGKLAMEKPDKAALKARYQGKLGIADFLCVDSQKAKTLIKFTDLGVNDIKFDTSPVSASIDTFEIKKPILNLAISSDGLLNFSKIVKTSGPDENKTDEDKSDKNRQTKTDTMGKSKDSSIPIKINQMIIEKGQVVFNDKSVAPNFKTRLTRINSKITGLSSKETIQSDILVTAMVNNHTPVKIKGKINPLKTDFFCDMIVACSGMDLGYLSPYSGKYAGYKIQKGKLSLDLKYLVDKQTLDAKNNIFLDQFDFGERVDSEEAVNAPLNLAVSLLKDPGGRISLDLPVKGRLDDPQFSVSGIIIKMIMNLLFKAATSPFSLLGAMFGGGEDLNIITFDAGYFDITSKGTQKIETLVKALAQRPGLSLEIAGYVNIAKDQSALLTMKFEQLLKAEKLKNLVAQGNAGIAIEEIELSEEEYDSYLKAVFNQTEEGILIAKKLNSKENNRKRSTDAKVADNNQTANLDVKKSAKNELPEITRDQMIQIIQKGIQVSDDELRHLGRDRALAVKDAILANGSIDPKRIFIIEGNSLESGTSDESEGSEGSEKSGEEDKSDKAVDFGSVIMTLK